MIIVALAWMYVVFMMAITESSVTAGIMTFVFYCVIPLGLVWFFATGIKRKFTRPPQSKKQEQNSSKCCEKKETKIL